MEMVESSTANGASTINGELLKKEGSKNRDEATSSQQSSKCTGKLQVKEERRDPPARAAKWKKRMRYQPGNVTFVKQKGPRHEYYKEMVKPEAKDEVEIPRAICIADRVESGAAEMRAMLKAVSQHTNNRTILQWLPRHMRRRAASHNRKRLPRRLHQVAADMAEQAQSDSAATSNKTTKPVNRKKRRRKRNLQNEYANRAGKHGWLETHMWHAKRFHMTESDDPKYKDWRHRVALFPNDKSFRACHRAVAKHCLIQDISYMRCFELSGAVVQLHALLRTISDYQNSDDDVVLGGQKEIVCMLHKTVATPGSNECIGPAWVLWRPKVHEISDVRKLLMWIHPVIHTSVKEEIESVCESLKISVTCRDISDQLLRFRLNGPKSSVTLMSVFRLLDKYPVCGEEDEGTDFCNWMVNNQGLVESLHHDFITVVEDCHRRIFAKPGTYTSSSDVPEYADGSVFPVITDDPRLTLPLDKTTPTLTATKSKYVKEVPVSLDSHCDAATYCDSPIWDDKIRGEVFQSKIPDHVVSTRKRQQKFRMNENQQEQWRSSLSTAVPALVIRKAPCTGRLLSAGNDEPPCEEKAEKGSHPGPVDDFASGWDVILPHGWGTAFWIPFVYNRVRVGGLRESCNISMECLVPHFPEDFPDTKSGKAVWEAEANKLATKFYRKPPAKRPNYCVLGVPDPFQPNWPDLFETTSDTNRTADSEAKDLKRCADEPVETGIVAKKSKLDGNETVEEKEVANDLKKELETTLTKLPTTETIPSQGCGDVNREGKIESVAKAVSVTVLRDLAALSSVKQWKDDFLSRAFYGTDAATEVPRPVIGRCLVCVSIKSLSKGIPFQRSMICVPTLADLSEFTTEITDPYKYGLQSVMGPAEPKHWDPYRKERKEARKNARKRKKKKAKEATVLSSDPAAIQPVDNTTAKPTADNPQTFSVQPSREVMGYVTSGDFVFSHACGLGLGFVSLEKLLALVQKQAEHGGVRNVLADEALRKAVCGVEGKLPVLALMRNAESVQYRFVKLELIVPS